MNLKKVSFNYEEFQNIDQLNKEDYSLMQEALKAREQAYAPYSNFKVGAAILLNNKEVVIGNNQENAAYPSGLCAERVAFFTANAQFPNQKITKIAICASAIDKIMSEPVAPCGACRQVMLEYEQKQQEPIEIMLYGIEGKVVKIFSTADLLPFNFHAKYL